MDSIRQEKVSRLLQRDLGEIFRAESRALFHGAMITVTKVRVTKDFSMARIYLSLFTQIDKTELITEIQDHSREIRYKLGKKIGKQLRVVPELYFFHDDSLDHIDRIDELLNP